MVRSFVLLIAVWAFGNVGKGNCNIADSKQNFKYKPKQYSLSLAVIKLAKQLLFNDALSSVNEEKRHCVPRKKCRYSWTVADWFEEICSETVLLTTCTLRAADCFLQSFNWTFPFATLSSFLFDFGWNAIGTKTSSILAFHIQRNSLTFLASSLWGEGEGRGGKGGGNGGQWRGGLCTGLPNKIASKTIKER